MLSRDRQRRSKRLLTAGKNEPGANPFLDNAYLQSIIDTVPDAMIVIDQCGTILTFSRTAERMFGYFANEVVGENINMLMPSPDRERHNGYLARYLATGKRHVIGIGRAVTARRRDGTTFPANVAVGEAKIDGQPIFIGFLQDLSETTEARRQLHVLQSELAHVARVSQMGTLATAIAHELNQPLAAMNNYVEASSAMLAEDASNVAPVREALELCANEIERAGQIIRRLRAFIASGETEKTHAKLGSVLDQSVTLALADNATASVSVSVHSDVAVDDILANRIQIQQVLVNLIRNAIEAMARSEGRVIDITTRAAGDNMVEVVVADSGCGLDPRIADRLFQPFETTKAHGMGLGLSICHSIVKAHSGRIWAEPSAFGGTEFHFTLQRFKGEAGLPS